MLNNENTTIEKTNEEYINTQKEVEFYSQSFAAFYNSGIEIDKTYIVLATLAIGLVLQASPINCSVILIFKILTLVLSIFCIYYATDTFSLNKKYTVHLLIKSKKFEKINKKLKTRAKNNKYRFIATLCFTTTYLLLNSFPSICK